MIVLLHGPTPWRLHDETLLDAAGVVLANVDLSDERTMATVTKMIETVNHQGWIAHVEYSPADATFKVIEIA